MLATLALWAVYAFAGTTAWWAELLRYLPYPIYLAPAVAALAASMWLGWAWRAAALAALALVLGGVMDFRWGHADPGSGALRLMTWNAKAFRHTTLADRDHRIAWEVLEHDPDVLVLQDADAFGDPGARLPEPVTAALRGRTVFAHGQYLVASRLPLRDCAALPMPVRGEAHDFLRCTVTVGTTDVDLVTAHLVSPRAGLNAARHEWFDGLDEWRQNYGDRLLQVAALVRALAGHPRPLIVAGDLNAAEASPVIRSLKAIGLRDAFGSAGFGFGYTLGHALRTGFSFLRIDHILVGPTIGVRDCIVGGRDASEHRPVIADLVVHRD